MAERAHPDDPGFGSKWKFRMRRGIVPWLSHNVSPFRKAFEARYREAAALSKGLDVLDIPCGMGWGTSYLSGAKSLIGIDIDEQSIHEAIECYGKKADFRVGSMAKLPVDDQSLDFIVCLEGIEHVPPEVGKSFLLESVRALRANGRIYISSPYRVDGQHSGNPYHIKEYQPDELLAILEPHFIIERRWERDVSDLRVMYIIGSKRQSDA